MSYLNSIFYDAFQNYSIFKKREFSSIIVDVTDQRTQQLIDWERLLDNLGTWTDSDIYILDFYAEGDFTKESSIAKNQRINFIQSTTLAEDFSLKETALPEGFSPSNLFSLNYANFGYGSIKNYTPITGLYQDIIQYIYELRNKDIDVLNINYMIGDGYLPAVNFSDVINERVDTRLFENRSILIINQQSSIVPTLVSQNNPVNSSQY